MEYTFIRRLASALCCAVLLGGCIDNDYDLSDVDTTVRVSVDNLVVPVNLNEAKLSSMLGLDPEPKPDSKIQVVNGSYAFVQDGEFSSKEIFIDAISFPSPDIKSTVTRIGLNGMQAVSAKAAAKTISVELPGSETLLSTEADNVSSSIVWPVLYLGTDFEMSINVSVSGLGGLEGALSLDGLTFKLPKGMSVPDKGYSAESGIYNAGKVVLDGGSAVIKLSVSGIDVKAAGIEYDETESKISFSENIGVVGGHLVLELDDVSAGSLPSECVLTTAYSLGDIYVTSYTGWMKYTLDGFNIQDVSLTDLPDVLTQEGTDLRLANPQIYCRLLNPLAKYKVSAQTGIGITSYVGDTQIGVYDLDEPYFRITAVPGKDNYEYYFSPEPVAALYPGYEGAGHVGYSDLSDVLGGDRVPDRLDIEFISPEVFEQKVEGLPLGTELGNVEGKYVFCAPLAFAADAKIVYSDVLDGWASEDLDCVVIETLEISAVLSTDLPVDVHFSGYPVDRDGKQIGGVKIEGADIEAGKGERPLNIRITGAIQGLDGICFTATVATDADTEALAPDMTILLRDIRPRVSGYYTKEL